MLTTHHPAGRFKTCPYVGLLNRTSLLQNEYSVNMIWHDSEPIAFNIRIMTRQFVPRRLNDATELVQMHFTVQHLTK